MLQTFRRLNPRTIGLWKGSTILILSTTKDYDWLRDFELRESWLLQLEIPSNVELAEAIYTLHVSLFNRQSISTMAFRPSGVSKPTRNTPQFFRSAKSLNYEIWHHVSPVYQQLGFTLLFRTSGVLWVFQLCSTSSRYSDFQTISDLWTHVFTIGRSKFSSVP
jgi:hypothetical protein